MNGYAYQSRRGVAYPVLDGSNSVFCTVNVTTCFGRADFFDSDIPQTAPVQWIFKNVAFAQPRCGDCIIAAALSASGETGLEAFLPPSSQPDDAAYHTPAGVPYIGDFGTDWRLMDFSLKTSSLAEGGTLRDYALRLIQRYSYILGEASMHRYVTGTLLMLQSQANLRTHTKVSTETQLLQRDCLPLWLTIGRPSSV